MCSNGTSTPWPKLRQITWDRGNHLGPADAYPSTMAMTSLFGDGKLVEKEPIYFSGFTVKLKRNKEKKDDARFF